MGDDSMFPSLKPRRGTAIPLISGGLDSTITTAWASQCFESTTPIFIDRRQSALVAEKESVNAVCKELKLSDCLEVVNIPFGWYVEEKRKGKKPFPHARNLILMSIASSLVAIRFDQGIILGRGSILTGFNKEDTDDTSEDFVSSFNECLKAAIGFNQDGKIGVEAPFHKCSKSQMLTFAKENSWHGLLRHTWSCYEDREKHGRRHCGKCPACIRRTRAFKEAGLEDPTEYEE